MKKLASVLLALVLSLTCVGAFAEGSITVFNWFDYIDESVIDMFQEETGIEVSYVNFTTNEEMFSKLKKTSGMYDVIFPSDYIIERMIKDDMLAELDLAAMPNVAGLTDWLKTPDYDPEGKFSVAYMWGTVGILYNTEMVDGEIDSWAAMFDEKFSRNVFMMDSIRDTLGITLKMLGYSMNTRNQDELFAARDALIKQKADGIVKGYLVDETKDKMVSGEAALALMWSGDALYSIEENEALAYVVPKEGSNVWVDGMCIPKDSQNIEDAQKFIDFLCRPDIARMNMEYIYYSTPIQAVVDEMDEEERNNLTLNPTQDILDRCEFFNDIADDMSIYDQIWMEVRA